MNRPRSPGDGLARLTILHWRRRPLQTNPIHSQISVLTDSALWHGSRMAHDETAKS
ncbi:hypothetical protein RISK_000171 [Rhodopirellula islandica]|uniref:Uncharacterized protein n=1 Tax=Rhodopirellula islandica TaxID=595434 RepID=A0A0J1BMW7_RHOIS|nr:hypothetical protein RISK_000171 [Rhodopirellula islandica]